MDPVTLTLTLIGLSLGVIGTISLVAWRFGRGRARVPALLLAAAVLALASPPLVQVATTVIGPSPDANAGAAHPEDAVVHPDDLIRR